MHLGATRLLFPAPSEWHTLNDFLSDLENSMWFMDCFVYWKKQGTICKTRLKRVYLRRCCSEDSFDITRNVRRSLRRAKTPSKREQLVCNLARCHVDVVSIPLSLSFCELCCRSSCCQFERCLPPNIIGFSWLPPQGLTGGEEFTMAHLERCRDEAS